MKRVLNGRTYDTDTAKRVAIWHYQDDADMAVIASLFRTEKGAWFVVFVTHDDENAQTEFEALSQEEAMRLPATVQNLDIIAPDLLPWPEEA